MGHRVRQLQDMADLEKSEEEVWFWAFRERPDPGWGLGHCRGSGDGSRRAPPTPPDHRGGQDPPS